MVFGFGSNDENSPIRLIKSERKFYMKKSFSFLIITIILSSTLLACQQGHSFPGDNSESDQSGQYELEES